MIIINFGMECKILFDPNRRTKSYICRINFTWRNLEFFVLSYKTENQPNILEKSNEAIWFVGDKVIKFSADTEFISNRVMNI